MDWITFINYFAVFFAIWQFVRDAKFCRIPYAIVNSVWHQGIRKTWFMDREILEMRESYSNFHDRRSECDYATVFKWKEASVDDEDELGKMVSFEIEGESHTLYLDNHGIGVIKDYLSDRQDCTSCIILPLHLHVIALPCSLSYFYIFTLLLRSIVICIFKFHHALSTSLGCFFNISTCFTFPCFSLLCSFLFVRGDHHPLMEGLSPFKGSSFLSPYLHCCNFFLVVFACFMVLLGLLRVVVFYRKHQRLIFPLFFLFFVATYFFYYCCYFSCSYL